MECNEYETTSGKPIRLWQGDCMEFMQQYKGWDLAIVDPPYNVGASDGSFGNRGHDSSTSDLKHYANADETPSSSYFKTLRSHTKNQIIWGFNYYPQHFEHSGAIIWHKKEDGPLSDCEIAYQSFDKKVKYFWAEWQGYLKGRETGTTRVHPNQKPIKLYRWLLTKYAEEGDTILDTHGGSMSLAIACYIEDFELDIIELDEDYYNDAVQRFEDHIKQTTLF